MALEWKTDPTPPREEFERLVNGGALADLQDAFREGVLIGMEKHVVGDGNDLEITVVLRHRSAVSGEPARWVDVSTFDKPLYEEQTDVHAAADSEWRIRHRLRAATGEQPSEWAAGRAPDATP